MSGYPLKAVLDLRRREEEAASARLADATRERAMAEAEEARIRARAAGARARWDDACGKDNGGGGGGAPIFVVTGVAATNRSRFVARCRQEVEQAEGALSTFQAGPLAHARAAERTARDLHLAARLAREAFDKHAETFRVAERKLAERREEETLEEVARASRRARGDDRS